MKLLNRYLLVKPATRMVIEWPVLIVVGIIGAIYTPYRLPFFPFSNIAGVIVFVAAISIHIRGHAIHKQADQKSDKIEKLITGGMFSTVRHPMYSSLMLMIIGMTIASGVTIMIIPAMILSYLTVMTAFREEEFLIDRFGDQYKAYMKKVPFRFIPRIF
ncbi:MAG: isoprenylcysteine carboxylmethyltransferase family protein [candidate division WOR-3 bacterium]|nr:MAG: isoprenylcysteine carboxylmethyltransferase family protein [candidate division WOR-3 bacterium]